MRAVPPSQMHQALQRRVPIAKVAFSDFKGKTRETWRFQDVGYLRGTPRPGLLVTIASRKIQGGTCSNDAPAGSAVSASKMHQTP